jgi:hypothetical protein
MEYKKTFRDETKNTNTGYDSGLSIGNDTWTCNTDMAVKCGWRMNTYLMKTGVDRIARELNIDTRGFTEADYERIGMLFFSRFMEFEKLKMLTESSLISAIRLHMEEKEASRMQWRRY